MAEEVLLTSVSLIFPVPLAVPPELIPVTVVRDHAKLVPVVALVAV